jgi:hypothetical protein
MTRGKEQEEGKEGSGKSKFNLDCNYLDNTVLISSIFDEHRNLVEANRLNPNKCVLATENGLTRAECYENEEKTTNNAKKN